MGKKRKFSVFSLIFRIVLIIGAAALFLAYISIFINPTKLWFPSFFGLYFIPIVGLNLILLVVATIRRSKSAFVPLISMLPILLFANLFLGINNEEAQEYQGREAVFISYNLGMFSADQKKTPRNITKENILKFISQENPSIACFQEFNTPDTASLRKMFRAYPYIHYHFYKLRNNEFFGNLTISKYPIISKGNISFKKSTNLSIYSDIKIGEKTVRVYNCHLESYNISFTSLVKKYRSKHEDFPAELIEVHGRMRGSNAKRAEQVEEVLKNIRESDYLSIVCGDFNDTPMSYTYHRLSKNRKDTFLEAGKGFSATYSTFWPMLRIDYILVPTPFEVASHKVHKIPYSDHYPVVTKIYI